MQYWLNKTKKQIVKLYQSALELKLNTVHNIIKLYWIVEHINLSELKLRVYYFLSKVQALTKVNQLIKKPLLARLENKIKSHDATYDLIILIITLLTTFKLIGV
jgi:hypothetical protein